MKSLSHVRLPATPWTSAHQALPSRGYSRQEYWSGVPLFSPHLQYRRPQFDSWVGKFPEKRDRLPTPVFTAFPGGSDSKESTCNSGDLGLKILGQKDPLEKGMATHCSILPWRIPWTEEPGGLQSTGWQRVRHD